MEHGWGIGRVLARAGDPPDSPVSDGPRGKREGGGGKRGKAERERGEQRDLTLRARGGGGNQPPATKKFGQKPAGLPAP